MSDDDQQVEAFFKTTDDASLSAAPKLTEQDVRELLDRNRSDLRRALSAPRPGSFFASSARFVDSPPRSPETASTA